ncbi:MAG: metal-dependent hydrolase [Rhodobiaceae bacterium]|nr:metal-dependent hydrolase [Rhodobiaceae bacterium]
MKITWFGHSAFRVETGGAVIMIDPFLSENPKYGKDALEAAKGATHVLLTHGHHDHIGDAVAICKGTGATLVANFEICMFLAGQGVENFSPGNHGGNVDYGAFSVALVPAWHSSSEIVDGKPVYLGNPGGLVIQPKSAGDKVLYHMGDTDIFTGMELINEIYQPAIGIVPVGDRFTMGGKVAAMACKRYFGFSTVIPCHYGTFPIIDPDPSAFLAAMTGENVLVPKIGEAFDL